MSGGVRYVLAEEVIDYGKCLERKRLAGEKSPEDCLRAMEARFSDVEFVGSARDSYERKVSWFKTQIRNDSEPVDQDEPSVPPKKPGKLSRKEKKRRKKLQEASGGGAPR